MVVSNPTTVLLSGVGVTINGGGTATNDERERLTTANKITIGLAILGRLLALLLFWRGGGEGCSAEEASKANSAVGGVSVGTEPKSADYGSEQSEVVQGSGCGHAGIDPNFVALYVA